MIEKILLMRNEGIRVFDEIREKSGTNNTQYDSAYNEIWFDFTDALVRLIEKYATTKEYQVRVNLHPLYEIEIRKQELIENELVITMDSYNIYPNGIMLGVSRAFNSNGLTQIGIEHRPGYPSVQIQLKKILEKYGRGPYTLVDDDTYTGGTLMYIHASAKIEGLIIDQIVVGNQIGDKKLNEIKTVNFFPQQGILDLNDPRDFLFGSYEGGLVINYLDKKARVPYILPFTSPYNRSGIPTDNEREFSKEIILLNRKTYKSIESRTKKSIVVGDGNQYFADYISYRYNLRPDNTTYIDLLDKISDI